MCLLHAAPFTPTVCVKIAFVPRHLPPQLFSSLFLNLMISLYSEAGQKDSTLTTTSSLSFDLRPNQRLGASGYCFIASHRNNSHLHHLLRGEREGGKVEDRGDEERVGGGITMCCEFHRFRRVVALLAGWEKEDCGSLNRFCRVMLLCLVFILSSWLSQIFCHGFARHSRVTFCTFYDEVRLHVVVIRTQPRTTCYNNNFTLDYILQTTA